jgi:hypothetical protein
VDGVGALTRRELARATAGAIGGTLLVAAHPALAAPEPLWAERIRALAAGTGPMRPVARSFQLLGVQAPGDPHGAALQLRVRYPDGTVSDWFDGRRMHGGLAEPVWTGRATGYQLRSSVPLHDLTVHFVAAAQPSPGARARAAAAAGAELPQLPAGPGQPAIIARCAWATAASVPRHPPEFGAVQLAFVHHTQTPNGYGQRDSAAIVQSICLFHRDVNGWNDIGYNFLIDRYGRVFEGRAGGIDEPVVGAHAGGYNAFSTGVAVIGSFMASAPPAAAVAALERLLAWKLSLHGVAVTGVTRVQVSPDIVLYGAFRPGQLVTLKRISGHRDGDQTDCPGDVLYGELPRIRRRTAALAGPTYELTLSVSPLAHPTPVPTTPLTASGVLRRAGGSPLAGRTIVVQQRGQLTESAIAGATVTTAADGSWQATFTLAQTSDVRAAHLSAPAIVSPPVSVGIAPALTLTVGPSAAAGVYVASGTVAPAKKTVILDVFQLLVAPGSPVYAIAPTPQKLISSRRLRASHGGFTASLTLTSPGSYLVIARTPADATHAAGASPSVALTV